MSEIKLDKDNFPVIKTQTTTGHNIDTNILSPTNHNILYTSIF